MASSLVFPLSFLALHAALAAAVVAVAVARYRASVARRRAVRASARDSPPTFVMVVGEGTKVETFGGTAATLPPGPLPAPTAPHTVGAAAHKLVQRAMGGGGFASFREVDAAGAVRRVLCYANGVRDNVVSGRCADQTQIPSAASR